MTVTFPVKEVAMRTNEEIRADIEKLKTDWPHGGVHGLAMLVLELLVDIRELLLKKGD